MDATGMYFTCMCSSVVMGMSNSCKCVYTMYIYNIYIYMCVCVCVVYLIYMPAYILYCIWPPPTSITNSW